MGSKQESMKCLDDNSYDRSKCNAVSSGRALKPFRCGESDADRLVDGCRGTAAQFFQAVSNAKCVHGLELMLLFVVSGLQEVMGE